jgi:cytochrome P450
MLISILSLSLLLIVITLLWTCYNYNVFVPANENNIPGYKYGLGRFKIPLFGDTIDFLLSAFTFLEDRVNKFGNICYCYVAFRNAVILSGADGMKTFYNEDLVGRHHGQLSIGKSFFGNLIVGMGGRILNTPQGRGYYTKREIINSVVSNQKLIQQFVPVLDTIIRRYITRWNSIRSFKFVDEFHLMCSEIACKFILGVDHEQIVRKVRGLNSDLLAGLNSVPMPLPGTRAYKSWKATRELRKLYRNILDEHMDSLDRIQAENLAFQETCVINILAQELKRNKIATRDGLVTEIHHMMLSTESLVGNACSNLILAFSQHSEVYEKVKKEVTEMLGSQYQKPITLDMLGALKYVNACTYEVRRLYPMVPGMMGFAKKDFEFQGYKVPKRYTIIGSFYTTNLDPKEWSEPRSFKPERFLSVNEPFSKEKTWAWMPHGASYHACPGRDLSTWVLMCIAAYFSWFNCKWQVSSGQNFEQDLKLFNPYPKDGLLVENFSTNIPGLSQSTTA